MNRSRLPFQKESFHAAEFGGSGARRCNEQYCARAYRGAPTHFVAEAEIPTRSLGERARSTRGKQMNKITLLAGIAIGAVLTAGVAQLQAQAPAAANTTRPAVFVITEQVITDQEKYDKDYRPQAMKTIKDAGGRYIVSTNEITPLAGDPPKRVVVLGFESVDEVKKWQGGEFAKLIPMREQIGKWRSFVVPTCENPQGAKPGQTKCP
jgi:uncharacterized protein (DUF1330 family)